MTGIQVVFAVLFILAIAMWDRWCRMKEAIESTRREVRAAEIQAEVDRMKMTLTAQAAAAELEARRELRLEIEREEAAAAEQRAADLAADAPIYADPFGDGFGDPTDAVIPPDFKPFDVAGVLDDDDGGQWIGITSAGVEQGLASPH